MKTVKVHQMQFIDKVKDIRSSIPRNMSTVQVVQSGIIITDAVREIGQCFSKLGQGVHRWCQRGIGRRTDVKVQILSA